ncbi:SLC13 family permease [Glycomyces salinus]|uniref:SLC13 family permease n=1 Tax=Glycomyces salinus TaxID=980294 RepID=UPI0018EC31B8|nr:DASS family sodium-coupled anion symporter [Glycomyces salinus]
MTTTTSIPSEAPPTAGLRLRRRIGLAAGPVLGLIVYLALLSSELSASARFVAAVAVLMAVWWMTEALPLAVTALIPMVAFPFVVGADTGEPIGMATAVAPYANPIIWLFMGGFVIGLAMQRWNLHRRFALGVVSRVGTNPVMLIAGFMIATAFISMWVSNTATTVMMYPVGLAVLSLLGDGENRDRNFSTALLLGIAYAASIGSVATLIGTPPNALLKGFAEQEYGIVIGFAEWMVVGIPLAVVFLVLAWLVLTRVVFPPRIREIAGSRELIRGQLSELGRMSRPEWTVAAVFFLAAASWIGFGLLGQNETFVENNTWFGSYNDAMVAMAAAIALFLIPVKSDGTRVLDWVAMKELPWGILLLFGGGLALSAQVSGTGLSVWIGEQVSALEGIPTWVVVLVVAASVLLLTELTSNTATTNTFLPVMAGVAAGLGIAPLTLLIPTALAATMAFMLPVATPPNAIVFGSGQIRIGQMVRGGALLNVISLVLIMAAMYTVVMWVFL